MENNKKKLSEVQFIQFVLSLSSSVMMQLGKVSNPLTGKIERDLNSAKATIDLIAMLKEKTKGNLSEEESGLLENSLANLQLNYVEELKKEEKEKEKEKKEEKKEPKKSKEK
jgi:hypothetical protein